MTLQRTVICIAGDFFAAGVAASQASAKSPRRAVQLRVHRLRREVLRTGRRRRLVRGNEKDHQELQIVAELP